MSALKFSDGTFQVSVCRHGHVTLEVLDGVAVKAVFVMSRSEAAGLAARLWSASESGPARRSSAFYSRLN